MEYDSAPSPPPAPFLVNVDAPAPAVADVDDGNQYHVVLEGIDIAYGIRGMGAVELQGARMFQRVGAEAAVSE